MYQQGKSVVASETAKNPCRYYDKLDFGECWFKGNPKGYNCDKFGHIAKDCHGKKAIQHVNYANYVDETPTIFYACNVATMKKCEDVWYVDCGCNNHMPGREDLLVHIDKSVTTKLEIYTG